MVLTGTNKGDVAKTKRFFARRVELFDQLAL
jgi:hypothetical protein